jgi:hypothetical protein
LALRSGVVAVVVEMEVLVVTCGKTALGALIADSRVPMSPGGMVDVVVDVAAAVKTMENEKMAEPRTNRLS